MLSHEAQNQKLIYLVENDGTWEEYQDKDAFLKFVSPYGSENLDSSTHKVLYKPLPFYDEVNILQISKIKDEEWGYAFFIEYGYEYAQLKGLFEVIAEVNETGVLKLTDDNVHDYLKFFCIFSDNQEGENARIIEGQNSEFIYDRSPYERTRFLRKYSGATIKKNEKLSHYDINTRIWSGNGVYDAHYEVTFDGRVTLKDSNLVGTV